MQHENVSKNKEIAKTIKNKEIAKAILERIEEKEKRGLEHLYDSDIYNIQNKLKNKGVQTTFHKIEVFLNSMANC